MRYGGIDPLTLALALVLKIPLQHTTQQISKDGDSFPVPLAVARMSELVKSMMDGTYPTVPFNVVTG
jgi:hypothetical protein